MMEMREMPSTLIYSTLPNSRDSNSSLPPNSFQLQQQQQPSRDPDPSSSSSPITVITPTPTPLIIRYRECLRNHAASMGIHVTDGCGEFMPNGEQGSPESLICAACECHRNFHRKEPQHGFNYHNYFPNKSRLIEPVMMMGFGGGSSGGGPTESSSEDLNMFQSNGRGQFSEQPPPSSSSSKKRFRTKFSQQQKERMMEFAEKLEWKIQKQDEEEVKQFCYHVGIKRQAFKVWMHNSKQAMKKKQTM